MRDATLFLQFKANEVLLWEGAAEKVSCGVFIRKAFVASHAAYTTEEVQAEGIDLDDVLYCSKSYRHAEHVSIKKLQAHMCHQFTMFKSN